MPTDTITAAVSPAAPVVGAGDLRPVRLPAPEPDPVKPPHPIARAPATAGRGSSVPPVRPRPPDRRGSPRPGTLHALGGISVEVEPIPPVKPFRQQALGLLAEPQLRQPLGRRPQQPVPHIHLTPGAATPAPRSTPGQADDRTPAHSRASPPSRSAPHTALRTGQQHIRTTARATPGQRQGPRRGGRFNARQRTLRSPTGDR